MDKIKCDYCQQEREPQDLKNGKIIYRSRDMRTGLATVASKTGRYCVDKGCHGYDQMGHEG